MTADAPGAPRGPDRGEQGSSVRLRQVLVDDPARRIAPRLFGVLPEGAVRRRPVDVTHLVTAVVALALLITIGHDALVDGGPLEFVSGALAGAPDTLALAVRAAASVGIAVVPALVALVLGRRRLAAALALAGVSAWLIAVGLEHVLGIADDRTAADTLVDGSAPSFPTVGVAVLAAIAGTAGPYLTRPTRRLVWSAALVVAALTVLQGTALPIDAIGALLVGWAVASAVLLIIGSPDGTPPTDQVAQAAASLGVPVTEVELSDRHTGAPRYRATSADGTALDIVVYGRDDTDARAAARLWRAVAYRGARRSGPVSRALAVEHEAYLTLLAERAGVGVGEVVAAGVAGPSDDAVLITGHVDGTPLAELDPEEVTDEVLDRAWAIVAHLRDARLAHGALDATTVLRGPDGLHVIDLHSGLSQASAAEQALDAIGLLATTASLVGAQRAVAAVRRTLGDDALVDLLPRCQPAALTAQAERQVAKPKAAMKELRDEAVRATGTEAPEPVKLYRLSWSDVAMVALTLFGLSLLVQQFTDAGDIWGELEDATWGWVVVAFVLAQLTNVTGAFVLTGAIPARLPLGSTIAVQFGQAFSGLVGGTAGNVTLVVRYCQKRGIPSTAALGAGMLNSLSGMVVQAVIVGLALLVGNATFDLSDLSDETSGSGGSATTLIALAAIAVAVVGAVLLVLPRLRRQLWAKAKPHVEELRAVLVGSVTQPRRALEIFGGQLGTQLLFALTLGASCLAYGYELNLATLILVNTFSSLLAGIAPVPGGMGVMEAALSAGLTAAGMDPSAAVAAAITHRLMTTYLPPIWGYIAIAWLRHRDEL